MIYSKLKKLNCTRKKKKKKNIVHYNIILNNMDHLIKE